MVLSEGVHLASLSAMYVQLICSSMNQELFEKYLCNQCSHYENMDDFHYAKEAITCYHQLHPFCCQQDEWDTKEDTGNSMKNTLYV